jgi:hypothetical protein
MKISLSFAILTGLSLALVAPALVLAQSAGTTAKSNTAKKPVAKKSATKKVSSSGFVSQSEEIKNLAAQFRSGKFNCEFDNSLTIEPNPAHPGYLTLTHKGTISNMLPVPTNTGALRLEGKASGLMWLQLPTKSMLMNNKLGQRVADECHAAN